MEISGYDYKNYDASEKAMMVTAREDIMDKEELVQTIKGYLMRCFKMQSNWEAVIRSALNIKSPAEIIFWEKLRLATTAKECWDAYTNSGVKSLCDYSLEKELQRHTCAKIRPMLLKEVQNARTLNAYLRLAGSLRFGFDGQFRDIESQAIKKIGSLLLKKLRDAKTLKEYRWIEKKAPSECDNVRKKVRTRINSLLLEELDSATTAEKCWYIIRGLDYKNRVAKSARAKVEVLLSKKLRSVKTFKEFRYIYLNACSSKGVGIQALAAALTMVKTVKQCTTLFLSRMSHDSVEHRMCIRKMAELLEKKSAKLKQQLAKV